MPISTLWVGLLPLRWTAVHKDVSEHGFTDIQTEGPAKKWEHTHTFKPLSDDETEIHEHIEYEHKSAIWGLVTRLLFARPNLYLMFTYRKLVTRWHLRDCADKPRTNSLGVCGFSGGKFSEQKTRSQNISPFA